MGYQLTRTQADEVFARLKDQYEVWAPMLMEGEGCFSDTDIIRYGQPETLDDIEWNRKSDYSFKEALIPINQTLFYFTQDQAIVPNEPKKEILIFLRSCDLHAVKRLDQIYLKNGDPDFYYSRVREKAHFVLMGCPESCKSGFCASMGTSHTEDYDFYLKVDGDRVLANVKNDAFADAFSCGRQADVKPDEVTENHEKVTLPKKLSNESFTLDIWKEYGGRCIGCGRCNFVCPTCTCFTMQDIFYKDNPKNGERRRVWASCQVDGYDTIAGGIKFRRTQADQMRFKVMHKIYDFEKRFGYTMCVGCGRCDDVCPEYISYSNLVNRLAKEEES